ncbi:DUF2975 domain-containing protein [Micromonospora sp. CPCC 206061]|uniref:DUF2975 domain-containing protein n=1 Tax=Micromonospora sp. CPCC 206061 TaxID=3122410 RepID=UPI002FEEBA79
MSGNLRGGRDWLRVAETAVSVFLGLTIVFALFVVAGAVRRNSVHVPVDAAGAGAADTPTGTTLVQNTHVDVHVTAATWWQAILHAVTILPTLVVVITALALLVRLLRHARRGDPFTAATVRRLRWLGGFLVVAGVASDAVEFAAATLLAHSLEPAGATAHYRFSASWILAGVGLLAVAELVNRGYHMRAELDRVI